jgi:cytochrome c biogenesis protein CcmG, thiol:disulfide interchange protein DsbE
MPKNRLNFLTVFTLSLLVCSCRWSFLTKDQNAANEALISNARTISGKDLDFKNSKFIVVNFWASWCGPCIQETPSLMRWATKYADEISLVAVSEDDSLKEVKNFLRLYPMAEGKNIFLVHDLDRKLSMGFGVNKFPETLIFNQKFQLLKKVEGAIDWSAIKLAD